MDKSAILLLLLVSISFISLASAAASPNQPSEECSNNNCINSSLSDNESGVNDQPSFDWALYLLIVPLALIVGILLYFKKLKG